MAAVRAAAVRAAAVAAEVAAAPAVASEVEVLAERVAPAAARADGTRRLESPGTFPVALPCLRSVHLGPSALGVLSYNITEVKMHLYSFTNSEYSTCTLQCLLYYTVK